MATVVTLPDADALARAGAERFAGHIAQATAAGRSPLVVLAGGRTPERLYQHLAASPLRDQVPWPDLYVTWSDERHVPPDDPDSNFGLAQRTLLEHVPIDARRVFRMRGELADPTAAAAECDAELRRGLAAADAWPFAPAVTLIGVGEDAHIASLFPGSPLLDEMSPEDGAAAGTAARAVAAVWVPHLDAWRLTLAPRALLASRSILVIASGSNKADAVYAALGAPFDIRRWPAQLLRSAGDRVTWLLDEAAAARWRDARHA